MNKWKCKKCGTIYEGENAPEKCAAEECDSTEFEKVEQDQENKQEDNKDINSKIDKKLEARRLENLEKQMAMLKESLDMEKAEKERIEKEKDAEILKLKKAQASEEELKAIEAEETKQKALEEQSRILKAAKEKEEENKKMREKLSQIEFDNFKLKTSIEKPWLESVLKKCDSRDKYEIMIEIIDESELKSKYESDQNIGGSVTRLQGAKPADEIKPKTPSQLLAERIKKKEKEIEEKRYRRR